MAENSDFIKPTIPKFDGFYEHWSMLMENLLRSKEYWNLIETGVTVAPANPTAEQRVAAASKLTDMKNESIDEYFARTLTIANKMTAHGERTEQVVVVEKILRSLTAKFNYVVCSIEESNDMTALSIVQEQRMKSQQISHGEQALKANNGGKGAGRGRGRGSIRGRGRENANYAEFLNEEETLLMARTESDERKVETWFLDSGCSNHMVDNKDWLYDFDEHYRDSVKLGDYSKMCVMGKGNVKLSIEGKVHVITGVFYILGLKSHLLSIGHIQQRNVTIVFKNDACKIYHNDKGLLFTTQMSANRMYVVNATVIMPKCLQVTKKDWSQLWHNRYGHLSIKRSNTLVHKDMVKGLPPLDELNAHNADCLTGKQHMDAIPKQAVWRANMKLELVHSDICGPLNPKSNGGNSNLGIKRHLTAAYTPQQNGVVERTNMTLLNMVRSMIAGRKVPKVFWPETVKWATYVMNRSPTLSVKNITPEEAWSGVKPSVHHFRVFGFLAFVHVPDSQKTKLEDKSIQCVHLGNTAEDNNSQDIEDDIEERRTEPVENLEEIPQVSNETGVHNGTNETTHIDDSDENMYVQDTSSDEGGSSQLPPRIRRTPAKLRDYVTGSQLEEEEAFDDQHNLAIYTPSDDPKNFVEANKLEIWRKVMDQEMESIENNETWQLTTLPEGSNVIGVKWIYKTKYNEKEEVEKHKARLVAKGYSRRHGVDYNEESMKKRFAMTDLGSMKYFLGVEVIQSDSGIFIHQHKYAAEILKRFGMENCNKVCSPIVPGCKLVKDENGNATDASKFKQMVGCLMYLLATMPDLAYSICLVARFMDMRTEMHIAAIKRIMRYLKGTLTDGIMYKHTTDTKLEFVGWSDSDYAGDLDDRKSTSGFVFMLGTSAISWSSKKQPIVSQDKSTAIYCDNSSSIKLSRNPIMHERCKHIDVRFHFLRNLTKDGVVELRHCKSQEQLADLMTKSLKLEAFDMLRGGLGMQGN
ncbi:hypothetical protein TSUD_257040 [Trifolium subterraneum]|uniref:Integrase catalytic domain-containing protein n=1 Tax=Trifolium subterraneum TaxID=3900 RepID=A0A2Z6M7V9_TRISU|nr:hypothetical protein TSUD_257040 [Trifolium subterraneum]